MIGIFKERNAFVVPFLFILAFALKFIFISNPLPPEAPTSGGMLEFWLHDRIWPRVQPGLLAIISIFILVASGLYLNYLLMERRMYQRNHMLTALSFVLFTSLFAGLQRMQPGILMLPITLILYRQMIRLYQSPQPKTVVVNMGLIAGTGILLYHPYWWMLPWCFWALAQMRPFRLNEWVLLILSFLIPIYVVLSFEYLTDQWNPQQHWPVWNPLITWPSVNPWWVTAISISLVWLVAGFSQWQDANRRMLIQTRKNWYLLLMMGVFIFPSLFYPGGNLYEGLTLFLLPASALGAYAFTGESRSGAKKLLFWVLLLAGILMSWAVFTQRM